VTDLQFALKLVHLIGAAVLFGTGLGIAFFMWMAHRSRDAATVAAVARIVIVADFVFTASAVIVQPISGAALAWLVGYSLWAPWIVASLALYVLVGLCWLPVVWLQIRMHGFARRAAAENAALPEAYDRLFRWWFGLGWPAFAGVIAIFALMIWKPAPW
jgi:uncharacterized membrane protein